MAGIVADQGSASCPQSRTLADLLDEMAARQPAREFIVGGATRLTYAEARARVRRLAKGLHQLGVRRGDKVALLLDNRAEWLLIDFAVTLLGATLVPISTWSRPRELGYVLSHCDATTFITVDRFMGNDYLAMLAEVGEPGSSRLPQLRRVVVRRRRDAPRTRCRLRRRSGTSGAGVGDADTRRLPARGEPRRRGVHSLHVGDDVDAEGGAAPAPRPHREPVEYRRAPAPGPRRSHVDGDLAVLELRLPERAPRRHDARGLRRPARSVRRGGRRSS